MPKYGYLVVEGHHDQAFAARLLSPFGLQAIEQQHELDEFFEGLVPTGFPVDGNLLKRVPIPLFVQNDSHAIAIHSAIGDSKLLNTVLDNKKVIEYDDLVGIGILLDADKEVPAEARYQEIRTGMKDIGFELPAIAGEVGKGSPQVAAYVLPDNSSVGTLEDLLIESGQQCYPSLITNATRFVDDAIVDGTVAAREKKYLKKPSGRNKAILGSVGNILRPGKSIQVSIQDNQWFKGECLALPRIKAVQEFLVKLFGLNQDEPNADSGESP